MEKTSENTAAPAAEPSMARDINHNNENAGEDAPARDNKRKFDDRDRGRRSGRGRGGKNMQHGSNKKRNMGRNENL